MKYGGHHKQLQLQQHPQLALPPCHHVLTDEEQKARDNDLLVGIHQQVDIRLVVGTQQAGSRQEEDTRLVLVGSLAEDIVRVQEDTVVEDSHNHDDYDQTAPYQTHAYHARHLPSFFLPISK